MHLLDLRGPFMTDDGPAAWHIVYIDLSPLPIGSFEMRVKKAGQ